MTSAKYSRVAALSDCIRLAKRVVKAGETKVADAASLWVFRLLAKITTSAISVDVLLREGCILDTKVLLRSMYDASIDLMLVMHAQLKTQQLAKLYEAELVEDHYERYKFEWERRGRTKEDFVDANPESKSLIEAYERQKKNKGKAPPSLGRDRFGILWKSRWRYLTSGEKLSHLPEFKKAMQRAVYLLRDLGNAHAHARPAALQHYAKSKKTSGFQRQSVTYLVNPKPSDSLYSKEELAFEACLLILVSCDQVVDQYYLDYRLSKRLQTIYNRIRALGKAKAKHKAQSRVRERGTR